MLLKVIPDGIGMLGSLRVLFCILICLPTILGSLDSDLSPRYIHPQGLITVPYGNTLDLYCEGDANNLTFMSNGAPEHSEKVNDTTIKFHKKLEKGVYTIYCLDQANKHKIPYRVLVDEPPQPVTDFKCISYNLNEFQCIWTDLMTFSITNYTLSVVINGKPVSICTPFRNGTKMICSWSTSSVPRYRQLENKFELLLTQSNVFGGNEQNFSIDHYSIVKPAPVRDLKLIEAGAYNAVLEWRLPNNMVDFLFDGVEHKIEYQVAKIDNTSHFRSVDTSMLPMRSRSYRLPLSVPYAHREYLLKISIRPMQANSDDYWSDPSILVFVTKGLSMSEINDMIFKQWRKCGKHSGDVFNSKLWRMRGEKPLRQAWRAAPAQPGPLNLLPYLYKAP